MKRTCLAVVMAAVAASTMLGGAPIAGAEKQPSLGAALAPIKLVATGDRPISIAGLHSYFDGIELEAAADGLVVVNKLPLERYLLGLNEVPTDWPTEALRAQAVAARTYALYTLARPRGGAAAVYGFDICASIQCQVFSGADVVAQGGGGAWARAVGDTAGEAVLYRGEPILARYHSTSGGSTLSNSDAFEGEPNYPYLKPVPSETEAASPLYRWTVAFPLDDLESILQRAGVWTRSAGRLVEVRTVPSRDDNFYPDVVMRGTRGRLRQTAEELRSVVRDLAPEMFPARYPSFALTSTGRLPETLPSERYVISTRHKVAEVRGRGWGHGVGMSQWGAEGMATNGASYTDILTHYYSDTSVASVEEGGDIAVGVAWARSEVAAHGSFRIVDGRGRVLVPNALGTWRFSFRGTDAIAVDPPRGLHLPLNVGVVESPPTVRAGRRVSLTVALSRPAKVTPSFEGEVTGTTSVKDAGKRTVTLRAPARPGRYRISVVADSGGDTDRSQAVGITVEAAPRAGPPGSKPMGDGLKIPGWLLITLIVAGAGLAIAAAAGTMKK